MAELMAALILILTMFGIPSCTDDGPTNQAICTWDASERGNGAGTDYLAIHGTTIYGDDSR